MRRIGELHDVVRVQWACALRVVARASVSERVRAAWWCVQRSLIVGKTDTVGVGLGLWVYTVWFVCGTVSWTDWTGVVERV